MALYSGDSGAYKKAQPRTPGGISPALIAASIAANPQASKGGYEGNTPMADPMQQAARDPNQGTSPSTGSTTNPIPGADVYLGYENQANDAYEKAKSQLLSQRNTLYHSYGLTDTGDVDPNNQYGQYQMLLNSQGSALDSARDNSAGRGIAGSGLGNQEESGLRFQQGADQQAFKNQVDQGNSDYYAGLNSAENTRSNAFLDAEQGQLQNTLLNQLFNPVTTATPPSTTPPPSEVVAKSQAAAKAKLIQSLSAKKVTANKTGATVQKGRGVISIH